VSINRQTCITLTCDKCGDTEFGHDYTPHFKDEAEASHSSAYFVGDKVYCDLCYSPRDDDEEDEEDAATSLTPGGGPGG
jgi:hypothetical protein